MQAISNKDKIKGILDNKPPISYKQFRYILDCGIKKIKPKNKPAFYLLNNQILKDGEPLEYISVIYNQYIYNEENEECNKFLDELVDIANNIPTFLDSVNRYITLGKYNGLDIKVDIWDYTSINDIAIIYLGKYILNRGFSYKWGSGLRKQFYQFLLAIGFL